MKILRSLLMAKRAFNLFIRIALFTVIMLLVAKAVPYEGGVNALTASFDFHNAQVLTRFILGEPDPEVWESLRDYISILVNTLISVPVMSVLITFFNGVTRRIRPGYLAKEWAFSTLRRLGKIFLFTFIFWLLFRTLPYSCFFPDEQAFSSLNLAAFLASNLLLTIACYYVVRTKIKLKRRG